MSFTAGNKSYFSLAPFIDLWLNILWGGILILQHSKRGTDLFGTAGMEELEEPPVGS